VVDNIPVHVDPARPAAPTLEQVAERAGVSRSTASRAINGGLRVSPEALASVEAAVTDLGYTPNRAARSLVTKRTDSIALVVPEPDDEVLVATLIVGAGEACDHAWYAFENAVTVALRLSPAGSVVVLNVDVCGPGTAQPVRVYRPLAAPALEQLAPPLGGPAGLRPTMIGWTSMRTACEAGTACAAVPVIPVNAKASAATIRDFIVSPYP